MKSIEFGLGLIAVSALFGVLSTSAWSQEWKDVKDPKEIRKLLSNKTLSGLGADGRQALSYFRADGVGLKVVEGERIPRTWTVKDEGMYCVTEKDEYCFRVQQSTAKPSEIRATFESGLHELEFHIEDGIPGF
jgi:hypothetical protein